MSSAIPNGQWIWIGKGFKNYFLNVFKLQPDVCNSFDDFVLYLRPEVWKHLTTFYYYCANGWGDSFKYLIHWFCWNSKIAEVDIDFRCPRCQISKWSVCSEFGISSSQPYGYLPAATVVTLTSSSQITAFYPTISLKIKNFIQALLWSEVFFLNELLAT